VAITLLILLFMYPLNRGFQGSRILFKQLALRAVRRLAYPNFRLTALAGRFGFSMLRQCDPGPHLLLEELGLPQRLLRVYHHPNVDLSRWVLTGSLLAAIL
jgi:hypothetical protein